MTTEVNMDNLSLDEIRKLAEQEALQAGEATSDEQQEARVDAKQPRDEKGRFAKQEAAPEPEAEDNEPEQVLYRRVLDLGDGAGPEVFEADSLEELVDKIADAKQHATKKIREQEVELKDLRERVKPQPKVIDADTEFVYSQELLSTPTVALKKMFRELTGYEIEDFASVKQAVDAANRQQSTNTAINSFLTTHPLYEDGGEIGVRNGDLMRMKLAELGLPATSENLHKAYLHLEKSGLLSLKGEEAQPGTDAKAKATERIVQTKVETTPRVTKKTSGISTHNRPTVAPVNTEPSEDDAYKMDMGKLRELANKQMSGRN